MHGEIVEAARQRKFEYVRQTLEQAVKIVGPNTTFAMRRYGIGIAHMNEAVIHTVSVDLDRGLAEGGVMMKGGGGGRGPGSEVFYILAVAPMCLRIGLLRIRM